LRLITLQYSQRGLTDARTFTTPSSQRPGGRRYGYLWHNE
jgi:hypothetical protein